MLARGPSGSRLGGYRSAPGFATSCPVRLHYFRRLTIYFLGVNISFLLPPRDELMKCFEDCSKDSDLIKKSIVASNPLPIITAGFWSDYLESC